MMQLKCYKCFLVLFTGLLFISSASAQNLVINEVQPANVWGITDEDGDHEDWIELYNGSGSTVNLTGYGLSDDPDQPFRWTFPSVNLQADHHLLIYASGKDRTSPNLHTNFKIKSSGEFVLLTDPSGTTIDQLETGFIPSDISRGRQPNGTGDWHYFAEPTPAGRNVTEGFPEMAEPPTIVQPAGFYSGSVPVQIQSSAPEAEVRYTLDGSPPTESSPLYASPLTITQTTSVRARCFRPGFLFSDIVTSSYMLDNNHDLAVVCLASDPDNFFDPQIGIYVYPNFYEDWERPVHIEFFEPDGSLGFSENGGVKTFGRASLMMNDQKSLALFARDKYNCESFDHQLFAQKSIVEFKSVVLRNGGNDWNSAMLRDGMLQTLVEHTDNDIQAYRPTIMFINGEYYGIHNLREKQNEDYLEANHGVNPDSVDILEDNAVVIEGSADHYNAMIDFIETHNMQLEQNYEYVKTQMDVTQYIQYEITEIYYANTDWPGLNIKFWRPQTSDGIWRWLLFDLDYGFGRWYGYNHNTLEWATDPNSFWSWWNPPWSTFLLRSMLENAEFKADFINYFADFMNVEFDPANVISLIDEVSATIEPEMPNHRARWNLGPMSAWYDSLDIVYEFANMRPQYMYEDIVDYFNLPGTANVTLSVNPLGAGRIQIHSVIAENYPWNGTYFQQVPVPLTALPHEGYRFAGWAGAVLPDSASVMLNLTGNVSITALFEPDSVADQSVVITEINYNSAPDFDTEDWLEFYNNSSQTIDISNWIFKDSNDDNTFVFPANTILQPAGLIVLCCDTAAFSSFHPEVTNIIGNMDFNLSNGGELVRLFNAAGEIVDSLTYDDAIPWPLEPDGQGPTLELIDPDLLNYEPGNWRASTLPHGSPGQQNGWNAISVTLTPYGTPIQLPAVGGSFDFNVEIANSSSNPETIDFWTMITLPDLSVYGPLINVANFSAPANWSGDRDRSQTVPGSAPAGMYHYDAYIGDYPGQIWAEDHFDFEKLSTGDGAWIEGWNSTGEPFEDWFLESGTLIPQEYALDQNYPNPFNPTTVLGFKLPDASFVKLTVYDITGRQVAHLVDGWRDAGVYEVTFDATGLASGIYVYRIEAGRFTGQGKMVLMK